MASRCRRACKHDTPLQATRVPLDAMACWRSMTFERGSVRGALLSIPCSFAPRRRMAVRRCPRPRSTTGGVNNSVLVGQEMRA
eukprot:4581551-Prymnesium_polylepis.2